MLISLTFSSCAERGGNVADDAWKRNSLRMKSCSVMRDWITDFGGHESFLISRLPVSSNRWLLLRSGSRPAKAPVIAAQLDAKWMAIRRCTLSLAMKKLSRKRRPRRSVALLESPAFLLQTNNSTTG